MLNTNILHLFHTFSAFHGIDIITLRKLHKSHSNDPFFKCVSFFITTFSSREDLACTFHEFLFCQDTWKIHELPNPDLYSNGLSHTQWAMNKGLDSATTLYRRKRPYGFIHWKMTMWVLHNWPNGCMRFCTSRHSFFAPILSFFNGWTHRVVFSCTGWQLMHFPDVLTRQELMIGIISVASPQTPQCLE